MDLKIFQTEKLPGKEKIFWIFLKFNKFSFYEIKVLKKERQIVLKYILRYECKNQVIVLFFIFTFLQVSL